MTRKTYMLGSVSVELKSIKNVTTKSWISFLGVNFMFCYVCTFLFPMIPLMLLLMLPLKLFNYLKITDFIKLFYFIKLN